MSGNVVYMVLSSGDILMIDAQTGQVLRDYYIGAPMDVSVTIGASATGRSTSSFRWGMRLRGRDDVSGILARRHPGPDPDQRPAAFDGASMTTVISTFTTTSVSTPSFSASITTS